MSGLQLTGWTSKSGCCQPSRPSLCERKEKMGAASEYSCAAPNLKAPCILPNTGSLAELLVASCGQHLAAGFPPGKTLFSAGSKSTVPRGVLRLPSAMLPSTATTQCTDEMIGLQIAGWTSKVQASPHERQSETGTT